MDPSLLLRFGMCFNTWTHSMRYKTTGYVLDNALTLRAKVGDYHEFSTLFTHVDLHILQLGRATMYQRRHSTNKNGSRLSLIILPPV